MIVHQTLRLQGQRGNSGCSVHVVQKSKRCGPSAAIGFKYFLADQEEKFPLI